MLDLGVKMVKPTAKVFFKTTQKKRFRSLLETYSHTTTSTENILSSSHKFLIIMILNSDTGTDHLMMNLHNKGRFGNAVSQLTGLCPI